MHSSPTDRLTLAASLTLARMQERKNERNSDEECALVSIGAVHIPFQGGLLVWVCELPVSNSLLSNRTQANSKPTSTTMTFDIQAALVSWFIPFQGSLLVWVCELPVSNSLLSNRTRANSKPTSTFDIQAALVSWFVQIGSPEGGPGGGLVIQLQATAHGLKPHRYADTSCLINMGSHARKENERR